MADWQRLILQPGGKWLCEERRQTEKAVWYQCCFLGSVSAGLLRMEKFMKDDIGVLGRILADTENDYAYLIRNDLCPWDYIVLTASDERQARIYQIQIDERLKEGRIPRKPRYLCLPDIEGKRIGSGGATVNVIKKLLEEDSEALDKRILLIHSGGDSRRVPQYSACGKIFAPIPICSGGSKRSTLFDEFLLSLCTIPNEIAPGMLVVSGDVLLILNPAQINLGGQPAALSIKADIQTGTEHGVFKADGEGVVESFLHKQSAEVLRSRMAVDANGDVDIDTGAVWLPKVVLEGLWDVMKDEFGFYVDENVRLNFYGDMVYPMARDSDMDGYMAQKGDSGEPTSALLQRRRRMFGALHQHPLRLVRLRPAKFVHFGTTAELLQLMRSGVESYAELNWSNSVLSNNRPSSGYTAINSYVSAEASIGDGSYLEDSFVNSASRIGERCIVSNINLESIDCVVPSGAVIHALPLEGGRFCVRFYGIEDNPKSRYWFGLDLGAPLWEARLFPNCGTIRQGLEYAVSVLERIASGKLGSLPIDGGYESLESSFQKTDSFRLLEWQEHLEDQIRAACFLDALREGGPVSEAASTILSSSDDRSRQLGRCLRMAGREPALLRARLFASIGFITGERSATEKAFALIRQSFIEACPPENPKAKALPLGDVEISLPARVNFAGGWTDTPPYCAEFGATVLNAAIKLNSVLPITARARSGNGPGTVTLRSLDQNEEVVIASPEDIMSCGDPSDTFAVHKASLLVAGIVEGGHPLAEQLAPFGGSLLVETESKLPKGSGLGTSSILSAAIIKAYGVLAGRRLSPERIGNLVLAAEQLMSTGGGWQDQLGGLMPSVKLIKTAPGLPQNYNIQTLDLSEETLRELEGRLLLVYTGQKRLAKNILRDIVQKVMLRDGPTLELLYEFQRLAVLMAFELEKGNIDNFSELLDRHWLLSKKLDSGISISIVEQIFNSCREFINGRFICGAGGGGFVIMMLKDSSLRPKAEAAIRSNFAGLGISVWKAEIVRDGMLA